MSEYLVTQTAHFTFKVEANSAEEAKKFASQLDYDDAWESCDDPVNSCLLYTSPSPRD